METERNEDSESENTPTPPGAPDRTPVKEPEKNSPKAPLGDPQPPEKKKPRL